MGVISEATVWDFYGLTAEEARASLAMNGLPIGLAQGVTLKQPVAGGETIKWADMAVDEETEAVRMRREMESRHRS